LPCWAASNSGWQATGLWPSSARYRRWNSFHLAGSWLNHRRRSSLGARFLHQASIGNAFFFIPRGHRRSTRKRAPSSFADGSYTRLIWITGPAEGGIVCALTHDGVSIDLDRFNVSSVISSHAIARRRIPGFSDARRLVPSKEDAVFARGARNRTAES
jgi:hypothetical protein